MTTYKRGRWPARLLRRLFNRPQKPRTASRVPRTYREVAADNQYGQLGVLPFTRHPNDECYVEPTKYTKPPRNDTRMFDEQISLYVDRISPRPFLRRTLPDGTSEWRES